MNLNWQICKTNVPEFGISFYTLADRIFVMQIGLYNRFLEIRLG